MATHADPIITEVFQAHATDVLALLVAVDTVWLEEAVAASVVVLVLLYYLQLLQEHSLIICHALLHARQRRI